VKAAARGGGGGEKFWGGLGLNSNRNKLITILILKDKERLHVLLRPTAVIFFPFGLCVKVGTIERLFFDAKPNNEARLSLSRRPRVVVACEFRVNSTVSAGHPATVHVINVRRGGPRELQGLRFTGLQKEYCENLLCAVSPALRMRDYFEGQRLKTGDLELVFGTKTIGKKAGRS